MSTWDEINSLTGQRLYKVPQSFPGLAPIRTILCSGFIKNLLTGLNARDEEKSRARELWADFDYFIDGHRIDLRPLFSLDEYAHMALLEPPALEVWELRSVDPPSLRVFGSYLRRNEFVALTWATRKELGGRYSNEWKVAIQEYREEWETYFGAAHPLAGSYADVNDYQDPYLSNARVIH